MDEESRSELMEEVEEEYDDIREDFKDSIKVTFNCLKIIIVRNLLKWT